MTLNDVVAVILRSFAEFGSVRASYITMVEGWPIVSETKFSPKNLTPIMITRCWVPRPRQDRYLKIGFVTETRPIFEDRPWDRDFETETWRLCDGPAVCNSLPYLLRVTIASQQTLSGRDWKLSDSDGQVPAPLCRLCNSRTVLEMSWLLSYLLTYSLLTYTRTALNSLWAHSSPTCKKASIWPI